MSGLSKVIVLDPDPRAARQTQLGFAREGVPTWIAPIPGTTEAYDPINKKWNQYDLNQVSNVNGGSWHGVINRASKNQRGKQIKENRVGHRAAVPLDRHLGARAGRLRPAGTLRLLSIYIRLA